MMYRILTCGLLAALGAFGAYGAFGPFLHNGAVKALVKIGNRDGTGAYCPGGPAPFPSWAYTGRAAVDGQVNSILCFFAMHLQGPQAEDVPWVSQYLFAQLLAAWTLVSLEGMRRGNRGRLVSWTGTVGLLFQRLTFTVCVPIYLAIHLFTSPVSNGYDATPQNLSVDVADLVTLPVALTVAYIIPTIMILIPSPEAPTFHYAWNLTWQLFPVLQSIYQWIGRRVAATKSSSPARSFQMINSIYRLVFAVAVLSQLALLAFAVSSSSLNVAFQRAFIPLWPWNTPMVEAQSITPAGDVRLAELTKLFLQWDVYCGGLAVLVWTMYVCVKAVPAKGFSSVVVRAVLYMVAGGPAGAAVALLMERDAAVLEAGAKKTQ